MILMNIVYFLTYDYSFKLWDETGNISREKEYFDHIYTKNKDYNFTFITYGDQKDLKDLEFIPIDPHNEMIRTVESVSDIPTECDRCFAFGGSRWHYIEFESGVNRGKPRIKYGTYKGGSVTESHYYSALFIAIKLIEAGFEGKSILIAGAPTRSVDWGTGPGQQNPAVWYKVDFDKFSYNIGKLGKRGENIIKIIEHVYELVFPFIV